MASNYIVGIKIWVGTYTLGTYTASKSNTRSKCSDQCSRQCNRQCNNRDSSFSGSLRINTLSSRQLTRLMTLNSFT